MASICYVHLGFIMTSSYCIGKLYFMFPLFGRLVSYFLKYLVFHVSAFWLEIAYFVLNVDDIL